MGNGSDGLFQFSQPQGVTLGEVAFAPIMAPIRQMSSYFNLQDGLVKERVWDQTWQRFDTKLGIKLLDCSTSIVSRFGAETALPLFSGLRSIGLHSLANVGYYDTVGDIGKIWFDPNTSLSQKFLKSTKTGTEGVTEQWLMNKTVDPLLKLTRFDQFKNWSADKASWLFKGRYKYTRGFSNFVSDILTKPVTTTTAETANVAAEITNLDEVVNVAAKTGQTVETVSNAVNTSKVVGATGEVASATTNTISNTANAVKVTSNTAEATSVAANIVTETGEVANVASKTNLLTKSLGFVSTLANSPVVKIGGRVLAPLAPALETFTGVSKIVDSNKELKNTKGMTEDQIESLRSERSEGYTKSIIGGGALAVGTGLLLASNPVGWTVLAGAGIYAGCDWLSEKIFHKSISSAIGDGARSIGNGVKSLWNWAFGGDEKNQTKLHGAGGSWDQPEKNVPAPNIISAPEVIQETQVNMHPAETKFKVSNEVIELQKMLNEKLTKEQLAKISRNHATIAEDGKLGAETARAMLEAGLGNEALAILGLGKDKIKELEKMAYSNDQNSFKILNSQDHFAENCTKKCNDLEKNMAYYEKGVGINYAKMQFDADTKKIMASFVDTTFASESTRVKTPVIPEGLLVLNDPKQPGR